jgi:hypothetical protein
MARTVTFTVKTSDRRPVYVEAIRIGSDSDFVIDMPIAQVMKHGDKITIDDHVIVGSEFDPREE